MRICILRKPNIYFLYRKFGIKSDFFVLFLLLAVVGFFEYFDMDIIKWNVRFAVEMVLQFLLHQQMFHRDSDTILSVINLAPKMIHPEYIQPK